MELFYNKDAKEGFEVKFDKFESNHILKSMRQKIGDEIYFTNGCGSLFKGIITTIKPEVNTNCTLIKTIPPDTHKIIMAVGFIRQNRLDFLIEKITEIGVHKIVLFASQNSNYYSNNIEKFQKITRQAIKQSQRLYLPEIETINNFEKMISNYSSCKNKFVTDQFAKMSLSEITKQDIIQNSTIFIIGPEGGLTEDEITFAKSNGYKNILLGKYRLRTETAALVFGSYLNSCIN